LIFFITQTGQQLVDNGVIPAKYQDDGLHLAFALLNGIDYIASWNFKHIVKPKTKAAVKLSRQDGAILKMNQKFKKTSSNAEK
jgi:hypothetical protein